MSQREDQESICTLILIERERQDRLKAEGRFRFTCADHDPHGAFTNAERYLVLAEEVGEVAREVLINRGLVQGKDVGWAPLKQELIQVAAICLAWIEYLSRPVSSRETLEKPGCEPS